jgi:cyanophycinase
VHFCETGNGYLVKERKFLPQAREGAVIKRQVSAK